MTTPGREEADRTRRIACEAAIDGALDARRATLLKPWMNDAQRRAIEDPLHRLRTALDAEHWTTAVGAAKDLAEAACKLTIQHACQEPPPNTSLPTLF